MTTFQEAIDTTKATLAAVPIYCGHGYYSVHDEAVALVLAAARMSATTDKSVLGAVLETTALERLADFVQQRAIHRLPTAYIIGKAWLGPLEFVCDSRALVPRSPLMEVIAADYQPWCTRPPRHIVDLCCGGGSLGILAALNRPDAVITLSDIDVDALNLARENLLMHAPPNARLLRADLLSGIAPRSIDVILANPPYVDGEDMQALPPEFGHEPNRALAAGVDGLLLVYRLLAEAADCLDEEGHLFLEVGNSWTALEEAFPHFAFEWLDLEWGGHGVCVIAQQELQYLRYGAGSE